MSGTDPSVDTDDSVNSGSARQAGSGGRSNPATPVPDSVLESVEARRTDDMAALYEAIKARVEAGELVPLPLQDIKDPIAQEDARATD